MVANGIFNSILHQLPTQISGMIFNDPTYQGISLSKFKYIRKRYGNHLFRIQES